MKKLLALIVLVSGFMPVFSQAQQKIFVGNTGVSFSSPCRPAMDRSQSRDSSTVYNGECETAGITYGFILVKLLHRKADLNEAEKITDDYLQYLHTSFNITHAEGYKKGLRLNHDERTRGMEDHWEDDQQNKWIVNAWTNGSFIAVVYCNGKSLNEGSTASFLHSLRFPQ